MRRLVRLTLVVVVVLLGLVALGPALFKPTGNAWPSSNARPPTACRRRT